MITFSNDEIGSFGMPRKWLLNLVKRAKALGWVRFFKPFFLKERGGGRGVRDYAPPVNSSEFLVY